MPVDPARGLSLRASRPQPHTSRAASSARPSGGPDGSWATRTRGEDMTERRPRDGRTAGLRAQKEARYERTGLCPRSPGGSTDTGMPVTSPRTSRAAMVRSRAQEREAPEATGRGRTPLMRSPVPGSLTAPSGKTNVTSRARRGSTRLSTKFSQAAPSVSTTFHHLWTTGGQASLATRPSRTSRPSGGRSSPRIGAPSSDRHGPTRRPGSPRRRRHRMLRPGPAHAGRCP